MKNEGKRTREARSDETTSALARRLNEGEKIALVWRDAAVERPYDGEHVVVLLEGRNGRVIECRYNGKTFTNVQSRSRLKSLHKWARTPENEQNRLIIKALAEARAQSGAAPCEDGRMARLAAEAAARAERQAARENARAERAQARAERARIEDALRRSMGAGEDERRAYLKGIWDSGVRAAYFVNAASVSGWMEGTKMFSLSMAARIAEATRRARDADPE